MSTSTRTSLTTTTTIVIVDQLQNHKKNTEKFELL